MVSMMNQAAIEALCSGLYLENYLDCMENLPDDLQRSVSRLRELDSVAHVSHLKDIANNQELYQSEVDHSRKRKFLVKIQQSLIKCREIADEKLKLVAIISEHIENRTRQLEQDRENLDPTRPSKPDNPAESPQSIKVSSNTVHKNNRLPIIEDRSENRNIIKRQRRQRQEISKEEERKEEEKPRKKKKHQRKNSLRGENRNENSNSANGADVSDRSPIDTGIDPDEPTYCLCDQVSYGQMIGCDNNDCRIEWFHFNCVQLTTKPKGKWYCPQCRGDRPNVKRSSNK